MDATSCEVPNRCSGICFLSFSILSALSDLRVDSVSMKPGAMQFVRMPNGANSLLHVLVSASIPAFAAEYADCPILPWAQMELMFKWLIMVNSQLIHPFTL